MGSGALCLALIALAPPTSASGESRVCGAYVVSTDHVRIDGLLSDPDSFTQTFRVRAPKPRRDSAKRPKPRRKPVFDVVHDLRPTDPGDTPLSQARIEVANVAAAPTRNEPMAVRITVKGARFAGSYRGRILLRGSKCRIPLTVTVATTPDLKLVGNADAVDLDLTRCSDFTCGPGGRITVFVPDKELRDNVTVPVSNRSQAAAEISKVTVEVKGSGEVRVPDKAVTVEHADIGTSVPATDVGDLPPISIDRDSLEAGHYDGTIFLTVTGDPARTEFQLKIDVRDGPFWAIVVLLGALGVLALMWVARRNAPRRSALRDLRKLRSEIARLHADDAALLQSRLDGVRTTIVDGHLEAATNQRKAIADDAARLTSARVLEKAAAKPPRGVPPRIAEQLTALREAVAEDTGNRREMLTDLRIAVEKLRRTPGTERLLTLELHAMPSRRLRNVLAPTAKDHSVSSVPLTKKVGAWVSLVLRRWRDAIEYGWLLFTTRPLPWLLRVAVVVIAVIAGLKELYFDNATFGDNWGSDYGALLLAGFTASAINVALTKFMPVD
jgi:hypothetical protein